MSYKTFRRLTYVVLACGAIILVLTGTSGDADFGDMYAVALFFGVGAYGLSVDEKKYNKMRKKKNKK